MSDKPRKPMPSRIFVVLDNDAGTKRLVEAKTKAAAIKHVSGQRFEAERPSDGELVNLVRKGVEIEKAAEDEGDEK